MVIHLTIYDLYLEKQEANKHEKNKKGSNGHIKYLHNYAISITFKRSSLEPHSELTYFRSFLPTLEGIGYDQKNGLTCSSL